MPKNLLFILEALLFSGCGFHLINPAQNRVYVEVFSNRSLQPGIEIFMVKNLKKTLAELPGFTPVSKKNSADIILEGTIQQFSRDPEFIAESDQIVMASYKIKILLEIIKNGKTTEKTFQQTYVVNLTRQLKTDELLDNISKKVSKDIYFQLINLDEKR
ncbi:MAG TPA: hypothetical protein PK303_06285 [bacterium]|nr:hypothetical protein [bacterium]HOL35222.1 hypothetical protein [bacterium]HPP08708.1 hypothetical protein [bacterium]